MAKPAPEFKIEPSTATVDVRSKQYFISHRSLAGRVMRAAFSCYYYCC